MGNHTSRSLKPEEAAKLKEKFSTVEIEMLWMIYDDLSARDFGMIDKETFLKFFPLTGLWGEQLFKKFDLNHTGLLTFFEFAYGIALCCKSTPEQKIKLLFSLYDFNNDGYIEKKEMVTMLYNYPRNYIKFITDEIAPDGGERLEGLTEAKRVQSIANVDDEDGGGNAIIPIDDQDDSIMNDYPSGAEAGGRKYTDDMDIANEGRNQDQANPLQRYNHGTDPKPTALKKFGSTNAGRSDKPLDLDNLPGAGAGGRRRKYSGNVRPSRTVSNAYILNQQSPNLSNVLKATKAHLMSGSTVIMDQSYVQATTINTRVKEYASFMFRNFEGASARGKISYEEFKDWLALHPVILKIFENSFHEDIWSPESVHKSSTTRPALTGHLDPHDLTRSSTMGERRSSLLPFQANDADLCGTLYKRGKKMKAWKARYFELRGDFLFYYSKHGGQLPKGIHFLEGCYVEETNDYNSTHKYGFKITYKNESYEPHCLYLTDKKKYDDWMTHLKGFQSSSIHDMYTFKEKIGTGKFSIVYRAVAKKNNSNEFAVKVIDKNGLKPEEREFVLMETSVMKVLNHPAMIKLIETVETKSAIYIVTELVKDGDLFEYIVNREFLEEYETSFIMKQLFVAMSYLHNVGIIHRDLKPENIMITLSEKKDKVKEVKIIDFGFAQFVTPGVILKETCGTPNYVAPDVLKGNGYDKRADVWSLGIIMFLMLRGRLPFDAHHVDDILKNTLKMPLPLDEEHWDNVSPDARDLVTKLLDRDMNSRITIQDALNHPWITNRENLRKYANRNQHAENNSNHASGYDSYYP